MDRFVCVHGHFYQPPRENPWLDEIELQAAAYPYHDWNERITAECYAPNAVSRILDDERRIVQICNNYARMSFNFGPTLLSWLERKQPKVYQAILRADIESRQRFSGHGNALAQVYNHLIMPLANARDRRTQVRWGLADFERRFGRRAEGMWLAETAVDLASLEVLAEHGIRFTILAPHQARSVRARGETTWNAVQGGIDPRRPYAVKLPSGREIVVFFYDGPISRAVAFESLLQRGETFAHRLLSGLDERRQGPQLVNIATDGETFGHHHLHGDMALAYCLHYVEAQGLARITNYGEFLDLCPPTHEVEIEENTSWSCAHGVERWRSDCGCATGGLGGWNQRWRAPLRAALDWLRDELAPRFASRAGRHLKDPWAARDDAIALVLDSSRDSQDRFFQQHALEELDEQERVTVLELLEMQRNALLMFTSCAWFFNDLAGIETIQCLQYAGRAIQLAEELFGPGIEEQFVQRLEPAQSNVKEHGDGRAVYARWVKPSKVGLEQVLAHFVVAGLFEPPERWSRVAGYRIQVEDWELLEAGRSRMALGKAQIRYEVTGEAARLAFWALHFGDHNLTAGVRTVPADADYVTMNDEGRAAFARADLPQLIRLVDRWFGDRTYSLKSLFRDDQNRVLDHILGNTLREVEDTYRHLHEHHAPLIRYLASLNVAQPKAFELMAEFVLNTGLKRALGEPNLDLVRVQHLLAEARHEHITLDGPGLGHAYAHALERLALHLQMAPSDLPALQTLRAAVGLVETLPFEINLWRTQNVYYELLHGPYLEISRRGASGNRVAAEWSRLFVDLGTALRVRLDLPAVARPS